MLNGGGDGMLISGGMNANTQSGERCFSRAFDISSNVRILGLVTAISKN